MYLHGRQQAAAHKHTHATSRFGSFRLDRLENTNWQGNTAGIKQRVFRHKQMRRLNDSAYKKKNTSKQAMPDDVPFY
jgi:hypothetical protein